MIIHHNRPGSRHNDWVSLTKGYLDAVPMFTRLIQECDQPDLNGGQFVVEVILSSSLPGPNLRAAAEQPETRLQFSQFLWDSVRTLAFQREKASGCEERRENQCQSCSIAV